MKGDGVAASWEGRAFPVAVLLATALGMALRAWHLAIPLRYDEAVTFLEYASGGFVHAATSYPTPNNHVLHTLLVHWATSLAGPYPFVIRLPAFVAGTLLVPAAAWLALRRHGPTVGVAAAFLVAGTPVLVEYSTNARGYTMVALATLAATVVGEEILRRPTARGWVALGVLGVVGLFTVPVMLLPWAGLTVWLWVNRFVDEGSLAERLRREVPLVIVLVVVTVVVVVLYLPLIRVNGIHALTANRFVAPLGWGALAASIPPALGAVGAHWSRAVPVPLVALAVAGLVASSALQSGHEQRRERFPLVLALLVGVAAVMLVQRNPGEARVWLWALPLVLVAAAAGLTDLLRRTVRRPLADRVTAGIAAAWFAVVAVHLVTDRALWRSLETGGFMEVEEVAGWLAERVDDEDTVVTDFVSWEPLRYYLSLHGENPEALRRRPGPRGRVWVVLNFADPDRPPRAARSAVSLGVPLDTSSPSATFGPVEIYGFGSEPIRRGEDGTAGTQPLPREGSASQNEAFDRDPPPDDGLP